MLLSFPGELLLNMLRMIILPLVIASLITAVAGLNATEAGKIGRRTLIYYLSTMHRQSMKCTMLQAPT